MKKQDLNQTKKIKKLSESQYVKLNTILENIIETEQLDEIFGIGPSQTPQQKAVEKKFKENFMGNIVGAITREIKAGKIDKSKDAPTPDEVAPTPDEVNDYENDPDRKMSISEYIVDTYIPAYTRNRVTKDSQYMASIKPLAIEVQKGWWFNKGKGALEKIAGLIFNVEYMDIPGSNRQPAAGGGAGAGGNADSAQAGAEVHSDLQNLANNWSRLTGEQKKKIKDYVAGLT